MHSFSLEDASARNLVQKEKIDDLRFCDFTGATAKCTICFSAIGIS
jgi:hypothetical protein